MDRQRNFDSGNNTMRDDTINFSLGYRHIAENNPEQYNVIMVLQLKITERK